MKRENLKCVVHPFGTLSALRFVVVVSVYNGKIMLSRHKERTTWETQGGHIEKGETPEAAARRELVEESGATRFTLIPVCDYFGYNGTAAATGQVFRADILELGELPESEMAEVAFFDEIPAELTYPNVTPRLIRAALG